MHKITQKNCAFKKGTRTFFFKFSKHKMSQLYNLCPKMRLNGGPKRQQFPAILDNFWF